MKFIVDAYIPFIQGVLEPYGDVVYATPDKITAESVRDADALLVRTRTKINRELLEGSRCRFVATATIGMDHFDTKWCMENGITSINAPGCNAPAVAQYVFASIGRLHKTPLEHTTLAIVGVGHVGGIVERWAKGLGMNVLRIDPPRQDAEGGNDWSTLYEAAEKADIITFHTPLTLSGKYPTHHLADEEFFNALKKKPLLINAARGPVADNKAWLKTMRLGKLSASVIDVWEGEPAIDKEIMMAADISTPHIAGYSLDGKIRATQMVLDGLSNFFNLPPLKADSRKACDIPEFITIDAAVSSYNPLSDTLLMRSEILKTQNENELRTTFEHLRDFYNLRPEIQL